MRTRAALSAAASLLASTLAHAQQAQPYSFYWGVTTDIALLNTTGVDWARQIDLRDAPINTNVQVLYQSNCGVFPLAGPHIPLMTPGYMEDHFKQLAKHLDKYIPDPNYDGLAIIDFETWRPLWDLTKNEPSSLPIDAEDMDFRDDWEEYMASVQPAKLKSLSGQAREDYLRDTYEAASRDFYLATLNECRRLRPNAKWSFYGYPMKIYRAAALTAPKVIGYGDLTYKASRINDRLAWLWGAVDFLNPSLYCVKRTVPSKELITMPGDENVPADSEQYILTNVAEAVRLANGKPVLPMVWTRYQNADLNYQFLNDLNLDHQLRLPHQAGAAGIVFWDGIDSLSSYQALQQYVDAKLAQTVSSIFLTLNGEQSAASPEPTPAPSSVASFSGQRTEAPSPRGNAARLARIRSSTGDNSSQSQQSTPPSSSVVTVTSGGN